MSTSSLSPELSELLRSSEQFTSKAILMSPHLAEGTVIFDTSGERAEVCGYFIPRKTKIQISENERCELLLARSSIVLKVTMSACPSETGNLERFRFKLAAWESLGQSISNLANSTDSSGEDEKKVSGI